MAVREEETSEPKNCVPLGGSGELSNNGKENGNYYSI